MRSQPVTSSCTFGFLARSPNFTATRHTPRSTAVGYKELHVYGCHIFIKARGTKESKAESVWGSEDKLSKTLTKSEALQEPAGGQPWKWLRQNHLFFKPIDMQLINNEKQTFAENVKN